MPDRAAAPHDGATRTGRSRGVLATILAAGFWTSCVLTLVLSLVFALLPRSLEFDLGSAPSVKKIGENLYRADFGRAIPENCVLTYKGEKLTRVDDLALVEKGNQQYSLDGPAGVIVWSSTADALERRQLFSYKLIANPQARPPLRRKVWLLLIPSLTMMFCGLGVKLVARRTEQGISLTNGSGRPPIRMLTEILVTPSASSAGRVGLVLACATGLSAALVPGWNRLISAPDSNSYVAHSEMRTPLVPYWIDAFDTERGFDRTSDLFDELGVVNYWGGSHRFIGSLRAWKLLLVASLCILAWRLSEFLPWWQVGGTIVAAASVDVALGPWSRGMTGYLDVVLSEGLSHALTILCMALVAGYLSRPGWTRGLMVAGCVNLLLLARPGNVPFVAVFALVWLFHLRRDTFRLATLRAGMLATVTFAGVLLHCGINYANYGHFKQHAFTGFNLMTTALQLATPEDVELFDEPDLKEFVRVCTVDLAHKRNPELTDAAATQNCWQLACPAYARVFGETVFVDPYKADAVFTTVAQGLLRRHGVEFARQVLGSFVRGFWTTWLHVPLLVVIAASLWTFLRTGNWPWLFIAWFAALPFLTVGPCCLTNTPLDRYRSQTYFAELWCAPLWLAMVVNHRLQRRQKTSVSTAENHGITNDAEGEASSLPKRENARQRELVASPLSPAHR